MKRFVHILVVALLLVIVLPTDASAQSRRQRVTGASAARWSRDRNGDSVLNITLLPIRIDEGIDLEKHARMVRAVKKVYPLAKEAAKRLDELDQQLATIDRKKDERAYTKAVEDALKEEITPMLWKMTRYEGKILIKLIDRECEQTGYELIQVFMGNFKAGFYQAFAALFGASLKKGYYPDGEDAEIEEIIFWVEQGVL